MRETVRTARSNKWSQALVAPILSQEVSCGLGVLFVTQQIDYEPQCIMHLSSALKGAGHEVELAIAARRDPLAVLQRFFAVGVGLPCTVPHPAPDQAAGQPPLSVAQQAVERWVIKNRVHPIKLSLQETLQTAWHFMRIKS